MKAGWATKTLEEACEFSNGLWKGEKEPFVNVGVIRNTNFTKDGALDDSDIAYLDVEVKKFEKRRLQFGDIILEKSGGGPKQPVGRVALFDKDDGLFSFSNFTSAIRVKNPNELDFRFLHKHLFWTYLSGVTEGMQSHSTGIRNLDGNAYKAIQIAIPPLPEQHRIVAILDEAFDGIATAKANTEKNLHNARSLFESHLQSVFMERGDGWNTKTLGECFRLKSGDGLTSKAMKAGKYPVYGGNGIAGMHDEFNLSGDNVIIGRVGALCGNARRINERIWLTDNAFKIVDFSYEFDSAFLTYLLNFKNLRGLARQAAQPVISNSSLKDLLLDFPAPPEQQRIAIQLDALVVEIERLESLYQQRLTALEDLKKSLLHQAFSGAF